MMQTYETFWLSENTFVGFYTKIKIREDDCKSRGESKFEMLVPVTLSLTEDLGNIQ